MSKVDHEVIIIQMSSRSNHDEHRDVEGIARLNARRHRLGRSPRVTLRGRANKFHRRRAERAHLPSMIQAVYSFIM